MRMIIFICAPAHNIINVFSEFPVQHLRLVVYVVCAVYSQQRAYTTAEIFHIDRSRS